MPYTNPAALQSVEDAVRAFNQALTGVIQMVPRTNQPDYVEFELTTGDCSMASAVGRTAGDQRVGPEQVPAGFCLPVYLHEIGHALALLHEQSRADRDGHVRINWANIEDRSQYYKERRFDSSRIKLTTATANPAGGSCEKTPVFSHAYR